MKENDKKNDSNSSYSLAFAMITIAGIIYILPEEYLFDWSKNLVTVILMISSVFFAFSVEKVLGDKGIFNNFGVAMLLFYMIYGIVLALEKFSWLNEWSVLIILILSIFPMFGFFEGLFSLINFIKENMKTNKGKLLELSLKMIPAFLPVVNLILKALKVI